MQATINSNLDTDAVSTLVVDPTMVLVGSGQLSTVEIIGPAIAGFLPRANPPQLTVSITTITGTAESLFRIGQNIIVAWGDDSELHIDSPIHVDEYGTLTLPETIYIENGGKLDVCGTLTSDTRSITSRDGGEVRFSGSATSIDVYELLIDYKGHLGPSAYCTDSSAKFSIKTAFYNTSSDFNVDSSKISISAGTKGELSKIGSALTNTTCKDKGNLELKRNQYCEITTGTFNYGTITLHPGSDLRILGHASGTKKTTITADNIVVMFQAKISSIGKGFQSGGPGAPSVSDQGASHGGGGLAYGKVNAPMEYGSNAKGATASSKRGGGQIKLDVKYSLTVDGEIDVNAQEKGSGGSVYIIASEMSGFGTITADGGSGGGGGGRIALKIDNTYSYTGDFSVQGGTDSSGKKTSAGWYI